MLKINYSQFAASIFVLFLLTSCQSTYIYKETVLPQKIILNNQTQTSLPKSAPDITVLNHYPSYPVSHLQLKNGLNVYYIQTHHLINTNSLFALAFKRNEHYPLIFNDLFLNWNALLFNLPDDGKKPQRLSTLSANAGAIVHAFSMNKISGKYLTALNEESDTILNLFSQLVTGLHFTEQELQRVKQDLAVNKRVESVSGHNLTWQLFKKISLPASMANLTTPSPDKYRHLRQKATLKQFKQFVKNSLLPENATLIILSPEPFDKIQSQIKNYFSNWLTRQKHPLTQNSTVIQPKPTVHYQPQEFWAIERKGSTQVDIRLGFWPQILTAKEHQSLEILGELLVGGGLASRMTNDLREKKGLTYFISSFIGKFSNLESQQFVSSTEPQKLPALLAGMKQHIQTALNHGITKSEFIAVKKRLVVKAHRHLLTNYQQLTQMLHLLTKTDSKDKKIDDLAQQIQLLDNLSYSDFQKALRSLKAIPQITLLAGDKKRLKHHLCKYYTNCKIHWYNNELN